MIERRKADFATIANGSTSSAVAAGKKCISIIGNLLKHPLTCKGGKPVVEVSCNITCNTLCHQTEVAQLHSADNNAAMLRF